MWSQHTYTYLSSDRIWHFLSAKFLHQKCSREIIFVLIVMTEIFFVVHTMYNY